MGCLVPRYVVPGGWMGGIIIRWFVRDERGIG